MTNHRMKQILASISQASKVLPSLNRNIHLSKAVPQYLVGHHQRMKDGTSEVLRNLERKGFSNLRIIRLEYIRIL